ncbi:MAG TPA: hypothetical protein ENK28_06010 [Aliiroseovarius sp.]|nr:hypothetical protein [Aliiroseovarius sp.]
MFPPGQQAAKLGALIKGAPPGAVKKDQLIRFDIKLHAFTGEQNTQKMSPMTKRRLTPAYVTPREAEEAFYENLNADEKAA